MIRRAGKAGTLASARASWLTMQCPLDQIRHVGLGSRGIKWIPPKILRLPEQALPPTLPHINAAKSDARLYQQLSSPYRPLRNSPHQFRLLILDPGTRGSAIKCRMIHQPLGSSTTLKYETVSYCWGELDDTTMLEVNGVLIKVPTSASNALQRLRLEDRARTIWIDAVCINQEDVSERGHQVAHMHLIYENGEQNLVWLGEDDGTVASAFRSVEILKEDIEQEVGDSVTFNETVMFPNGRPRHAKARLPLNIDIAALLKLFSRPWFSRMWIVQEAGLAASNLCYCGPHECDLTDVLIAAHWLWYKQHYISLSSHAHEKLLDRVGFPIVLRAFVDRFGAYSKVLPKAQRGSAISQLLRNLSRFEARDHRDHVYGILGLYRKLSATKTLPDSLRPDYSRNWPEVFRDATRCAIQESGSLHVLSSIFHRFDDNERPLDMPTWVPLWLRKRDHTLDSQSLATFFQAGKGSQAEVLRSDKQLLSLKGLYLGGRKYAAVKATSEPLEYGPCFEPFFKSIESAFDTFSNDGSVGETSPPHSNQEFQYHGQRSRVPAWTTWHRLPSSLLPRSTPAGLHDRISTPEDDDNLAILAATLLAGCNADNEPPDRIDHDGFKAFQAYRARFGTFPNLAWYSMTSIEVLNKDSRSAARFLNGAYTACHRRRFFITKDGRFGLGPQTMAPGDVVTVLYGGRYPFILRPFSDSFQLIGECYVHGIMYGEAVDEHRAQGREDVIFNII